MCCKICRCLQVDDVGAKLVGSHGKEPTGKKAREHKKCVVPKVLSFIYPTIEIATDPCSLTSCDSLNNIANIIEQ